MGEPTFKADAQIVETVEAYALDAVDLASQNFGVKLDWSENSIQKVEQMLARLHVEMSNARPTEDTIWSFAKLFGSYIGEVIRRHHGGEWGSMALDGQSFPGLRQTGGELIWP